MKSKIDTGLTWIVEHIRNGEVLSKDVVHNTVPTEGLTHMADVIFCDGTKVSTWYIAPFEGNYTIDPGIKASTFAAAAGECVAYTPGARVEFVNGAAADGAVDNTANKAEFTFTADKTLYGAAMLSSSPRGSTTGVLVSIVRFPSPKAMTTGDTLRISAGANFVSA